MSARKRAMRTMVPPLSLVTGPAAWINRVITIGLLPSPIRDQYRFHWNDTRARQFMRTMRTMRAIRSVLPRVVALWPDARKK